MPLKVYRMTKSLLRMGAGAAVSSDGLSATAPDLKVPLLSDVELDFQRSVQAVLRELNTPTPALQSNRGKSWSRKQPLLAPLYPLTPPPTLPPITTPTSPVPSGHHCPRHSRKGQARPGALR